MVEDRHSLGTLFVEYLLPTAILRERRGLRVLLTAEASYCARVKLAVREVTLPMARAVEELRVSYTVSDKLPFAVFSLTTIDHSKTGVRSRSQSQLLS